MLLDELRNNINICEEKIEKVLFRCGRSEKVTIVGASKTMNREIIDLVEENRLLKILGENRVQELVEKYKPTDKLEWHFIGTLQSNKVKNVVDKVSLIHSVDKISLAIVIDKESAKINKVTNVLLQINMGKEESKSGFFIEDIPYAIDEIGKLKSVKVVGLMAVMPIADELEMIALYKNLGEFYRKMQKKYNFVYLSAGMTNDYELAIEYAGANLVRIGRAIFGERVYPHTEEL